MADAAEFFTGSDALALAKAIEQGDKKAIETLVGKIDVNAKHNRGMTFLMWSFASTNLDSAKTLLALGADPNIVVEDATPLSFATGYPDIAWLKTLVEAGVNVNENTTGRPTWMEVIYAHNWGHLDYLIAHGIDVNATDSVGYTAIMTLAGLNQYEQVMKLIEHGANITATTRNGLSFAYRVQEWVPENNENENRYRNQVVKLLEAEGITFPVLSPKELREQGKSR